MPKTLEQIETYVNRLFANKTLEIDEKANI